MYPVELPIMCDDAHRVVYAKTQRQYRPLTTLRKPDGKVLIGWKFTIRERLRVLFFGIVYHEVMTFGAPLQPIRLFVNVKKVETWNHNLRLDAIEKLQHLSIYEWWTEIAVPRARKYFREKVINRVALFILNLFTSKEWNSEVHGIKRILINWACKKLGITLL